jgi:catechol 2,3-dioxygenase-like lactoylglutathione lyase family enzyme
VKWWGQLGFDPVGTEESIAWEHAGESVEVRQQRVVVDGQPPFELRLTSWPHGSSLGMAHSRANHRGLFPIALAIDDVRSAVEAARALGGIDAGEATWGELPGMPLGMWASFFRDPDGVMVEYIELSR